MSGPVTVDEIRRTTTIRTTFDRLPGGGYAYTLIDDAVRIEVRYLRRDHGQLHAEVDVQCDWAGARRHEGSLSCADLNLSSQPARKSLAKYCGERAQDDRPMTSTGSASLTQPASKIIRAEREGDDVIVLDDAPDVVERDFDVLGLKVPADAASHVDRPRRQPEVADRRCWCSARWRSAGSRCCISIGNGPRTGIRRGSTGCSARTASTACTICDVGRRWSSRPTASAGTATPTRSTSSAWTSVGLACDGKLSRRRRRDPVSPGAGHAAAGTLRGARPEELPRPDAKGDADRAVRLGVLLEPVPHVLAGEEAARRHRRPRHRRACSRRSKTTATASGRSAWSSPSSRADRACGRSIWPTSRGSPTSCRCPPGSRTLLQARAADVRADRRGTWTRRPTASSRP